MNKFKKPLKRWLAAIMAATFIVPSVPAEVSGVTGDTVMAAEDTQIVSDPETVYINSYRGNARTLDFNSNWKFSLTTDEAFSEAYNDSAWKSVNLPHDYSIEQDYITTGEVESGLRPGGTGWYRKRFTVDPSWEGKQVTLEFDGVYMDSTVYLNGEKLGNHPYGYTPFGFALNNLNYDGENVIAVKVDHQIPSSRWYSGSGIYRDVTLVVTDQLHIDRYGVTVTTPDLEENLENPKVSIVTKVRNDGTSPSAEGLKVVHSIFEKDQEEVKETKETALASAITNGTAQEVTTEIIMSETPKLWSSWDTGTPSLYTLRTEIKNSNGDVLDSYDTDFGFRYFEFDREKGFSINGEYIKLKGVCMHHDQGALGAEAWEDAISRQVKLLKEMGCNSIRVTHNPAAQVLLEICDREGMLVIDEFFDGWARKKNYNTYDYARFFQMAIEENNNILGKSETGSMTWAEYDLKMAIERGKNSPSIIMWSLGNEILEGVYDSYDGQRDYIDVSKQMIQWIKSTDKDGYRKITFGDNKLKQDNQTAIGVANAIHEAGGIVGFNYADWGTMRNKTITYSNNAWIVYGSETSSPQNSRGVYEVLGTDGGGQSGQSHLKNFALTSYDNQRAGWGATASKAWWETVRYDANLGEYIWTGFDYLGEPTPWNNDRSGNFSFSSWPKSAYFGAIDTAGFPKDNFYLYRSLWLESEEDYTVHVLPTWDEDDVKINSNGVKVDVYSDAPKVELWLTKTDGSRVKVGDAQRMVEVKSSIGWNTDANGSLDTLDGQYTYRKVENKSGHTSLYYTWYVPYEAGTLEAVAYDKNDQVIEQSKIVGRNKVSTTSGANKLALTVDERTLLSEENPTIHADGKSLAYVEIDILDRDGKPVNSAENEITVTVTGNGKLVGLDNGFQGDYTSYQAPKRDAHRGKLLAIVQADDKAGSFTVTASAD
ncbi:MAG: DUF4982 domain-containing protein, partial [Lachnospiraceae bacterium]|nr:DUF4982 domain-containing protein [Lachnospiraceae bacterium]